MRRAIGRIIPLISSPCGIRGRDKHRPRDQLEQIGAERGVALNVALEADSLSLQTHIVAEGGIYALLGPYAIAAASKDRQLQSSKLVDPVVTRHIALAMSRHGSMTLACRTVMEMTREIAKSGAARLRRA